MEGIKTRYNAMKKALSRLNEALNELNKDLPESQHQMIRDSVIQRFEFCADSLWKLLKLYVSDTMKISTGLGNPRGVFKACLDAQLINSEELRELLNIMEDRNMSSHTYNENLAESMSQRIPTYYNLMVAITDRIKL